MWHVIADEDYDPPGRIVSTHATLAEVSEALHVERVRLQARPHDAGFNWEAPGVDLAVRSDRRGHKLAT